MEKRVAKIIVTGCANCPFMEVVDDPDPHDSFNADDVAMLCKLCENDKESKYYASKKLFEHKPIDVSIRPYQVKDYMSFPDFCPLKKL